MKAAGSASGIDANSREVLAPGISLHLTSMNAVQREAGRAHGSGPEPSLAFSESVSLSLIGTLDRRALGTAVCKIGSRQPRLPNAVSPKGEDLGVDAPVDLAIQELDLSRLSADERAVHVRARRQAAVETPFDLERGPLIRIELLVLSPSEHLLLLTADRRMCSRGSLSTFARELGTAYTHALRGDRVQPGLCAPVTDGTSARPRAEQTPLAPENARQALSFSDRVVPALELPLDRPCRRSSPFRAAHEVVHLDAGFVIALRSLGASHGADVRATVFAGFATLMRRISGQADVVIGVALQPPVAGPDSGCSVDIVPVRTKAGPGESFSSLVGAAVAALLGAYTRADLAHIEHWQTSAALDGSGFLPSVNVVFNFDASFDAEDVVWSGLEFDLQVNTRSYTSHELMLDIVPERGGLRLECEYASDLFEAASVRRWMRLFVTLLRSAVANPSQPWDELDWLPSDELQALDELQPAPSVYDANWLVHQRFEARAKALPKSTALVFDGVGISYAALDRRANAMARALRACGVERDGRVGICIERGPDLLAAVLGVLKAGAAFLLLDPAGPADRLSGVAEDAHLAVLVTQKELGERIASGEVRVLRLPGDIDLDASGRPLPEDEHQAAISASTAYLAYAPDAAGGPTVVAVSHRSLVNHLTSMAVRPGFTSYDRLVAVSPVSSDISILELLLPLVSGGCVVLAGSADLQDGASLRQLVESSRATAMQAVPSVWSALLDAGWPGGRRFKALCGRGPLSPELVAALHARVGELWHMYGVAEATIWSACARLTPAMRDMPLGKPIANTRIHVLDRDLRPCPIGVPGELWIAGDGVALDYPNRDELAAGYFHVDPRSEAGECMVRTGDLGRWRNDGMLEYIGRADAHRSTWQDGDEHHVP